MIYLERHDPARNIARYYCLTVERNLFGEFSLVRMWGRIGQPSQTKIELHATEQEAQAAMLRRMWQKQRRGYGELVAKGHMLHGRLESKDSRPSRHFLFHEADKRGIDVVRPETLLQLHGELLPNRVIVPSRS